MPSMSEIIAERTGLGDADHAWLKAVVAEWQLLADLSFSDLVLWVPDTDENVFWAVAQIRPTTGPTALIDDVIGDLIAYSPEHLVSEAYLSGEMTRTSEGKLQAGIPVDVHALPIRRGDRVIAVIEQHTSQLGVRAPSSLEQSYLKTADDLARMIADGGFPIPDEGDDALGPRVGDGFIRIDTEGTVEYASPNALSAYRRFGLIGDLEDENLAELTADLVPVPDRPVDDSLRSVLSGRSARRAEAVAGDAHMLLRALPLARGKERLGAMVLCRDVSDLRRRERELVTKNATIREIHHRVKNNLQTVAALLRMQARRIDAPEAKAALGEAMSRVESIAIVHEALSQTFDESVDFDRVVDGVLKLVGDVASPDGTAVAAREGSFGVMTATMATSLSMVITELCQNAVEHGLAGRSGVVIVRPTRRPASKSAGGELQIEILDGGVGLPEGFDWRSSRSLGLSIVNTLVAELRGTLDLGSNPDGTGTRACVVVPLDQPAR